MEADKKTKPAKPKLSAGKIRPWVQFAFLWVWMLPIRAVQGIPSCTFHCYACPLASFACPVGVAASSSAAHIIPWMLIGVIVAVGAFFGSLVCLWACPFGFIQDLLARIPTPKFNLPKSLRHFRFVVLIGLVIIGPYFSYKFADDKKLETTTEPKIIALDAASPDYKLLAIKRDIQIAESKLESLSSSQPIEPKVNNPYYICNQCPVGALESGLPAVILGKLPKGAQQWCIERGFYPASVSILHKTKYYILAGLLIVTIFFKRIWCHMFCPLGGVLAVFNRISIFHLKYKGKPCPNCNKCRPNCGRI